MWMWFEKGKNDSFKSTSSWKKKHEELGNWAKPVKFEFFKKLFIIVKICYH